MVSITVYWYYVYYNVACRIVTSKLGADLGLPDSWLIEIFMVQRLRRPIMMKSRSTLSLLLPLRNGTMILNIGR